MANDPRENLEAIARGAAAERAAEYFKDNLLRQWREAVGLALSAAAKKDRDAAMTAVIQLAAVKKIADSIRFDISEAHTAQELLKFRE